MKRSAFVRHRSCCGVGPKGAQAAKMFGTACRLLSNAKKPDCAPGFTADRTCSQLPQLSNQVNVEPVRQDYRRDAAGPGMWTLVLFAILASIAVTPAPALAQSLPAPSRTIYKCTINGKASYSDSPCLGAKKIDVEPTRGFSKATGRELVGSDIRREQAHEAFADAVKPLTGLDAKQLDARGRRFTLTAVASRECGRLDQDMATAEAEENRVDRSTLGPAQQRLFKLRQRFRELRC
ncbi:MAG: hypothetical protein JWR22_3403 [Herminiimonas sp.]|nr:hypothetical protein [Herminiimonas sp.]